AVIAGQLLQGGGPAGEMRRNPLGAGWVEKRPGQAAAVTRRDQIRDLAKGHHTALPREPGARYSTPSSAACTPRRQAAHHNPTGPPSSTVPQEGPRRAGKGPVIERSFRARTARLDVVL